GDAVLRVGDVVLDERVGGPAVDAARAAAAVAVAARIGHGVAVARAPALAGGEVSGIGPVDAVVAARTEVHGHRAAPVGPERIVVAVVGTGLTRRDRPVDTGERVVVGGHDVRAS